MATLKARRNVYDTDEVPHLWAHGIPEGRTIRNAGGNLYADGDTIYSYGGHFPIAMRVVLPHAPITVGTFPAKGRRKVWDTTGPVTVFLMTTRSASKTTAKHCSLVARAMSGNGRVFRLDPVDAGGRGLWEALTDRKRSARPVAEWFQTHIDAAERAAAAPRILARTRAKLQGEADSLLEEWREVHRTFGLRLSVDTVKTTGSVEAIRAKYAPQFAKEAAANARAEQAAREAAAKEAARAAVRAEKAAALIPEWRAGGFPTREIVSGTNRYAVSIKDVPYPVLRLVTDGGEHVQTSFGANVPADEARRALALLPRLIERMGVRDESMEVGSFRGMTATREAVRIGCHSIPWAEVRAFCEYVHWECPALPA